MLPDCIEITCAWRNACGFSPMNQWLCLVVCVMWFFDKLLAIVMKIWNICNLTCTFIPVPVVLQAGNAFVRGFPKFCILVSRKLAVYVSICCLLLRLLHYGHLYWRIITTIIITYFVFWAPLQSVWLLDVAKPQAGSSVFRVEMEERLSWIVHGVKYWTGNLIPCFLKYWCTWFTAHCDQKSCNRTELVFFELVMLFLMRPSCAISRRILPKYHHFCLF